MTFLDTGFLFALVSSKDEHHARVVEVFQTFQNLKLRDHLVTTNHVVAETITLTRKIGHGQASRLGDQLYGEKLASIHWTTPDEERAAFDYFKRHKDQAYSLVDCISFIVMEKLGIRRGAGGRFRLHTPLRRAPGSQAHLGPFRTVPTVRSTNGCRAWHRDNL